MTAVYSNFWLLVSMETSTQDSKAENEKTNTEEESQTTRRRENEGEAMSVVPENNGEMSWRREEKEGAMEEGGEEAGVLQKLWQWLNDGVLLNSRQLREKYTNVSEKDEAQTQRIRE